MIVKNYVVYVSDVLAQGMMISYSYQIQQSTHVNILNIHSTLHDIATTIQFVL
jgi:hypothetical protein